MGLGRKLKKLGSKGLNVFSLGLMGDGPLSGDPGDPAPGAPDMRFLDDISKFDFLKNPGSRYGALRDAPGANRYLVDPSGLAGGAAAMGAEGDEAFGDYMGAINAPSSVDDVMGQIDDDAMAQLLAGIDEDTGMAASDLTMDFADRGVAGPGQLSDAEASGLGRLAGQGVKAKAGARTDFARAKLGRLADREKAAIGAYGQRYATESDEASRIMSMLFGAGESEADRALQTELGLAGFESGDTRAYADLLNSRDLAKAGQLSSMYNTQYANRRDPKASVGESLLRNIQIGVRP